MPRAGICKQFLKAGSGCRNLRFAPECFASLSRRLRVPFPNASCSFNLQAFCAILAVLRQQMIDSEADMEKTEIKNGSEIYDTVRELLRLFGADSVQTVEFTDS